MVLENSPPSQPLPASATGGPPPTAASGPPPTAISPRVKIRFREGEPYRYLTPRPSSSTTTGSRTTVPPSASETGLVGNPLLNRETAQPGENKPDLERPLPPTDLGKQPVKEVSKKLKNKLFNFPAKLKAALIKGKRKASFCSSSSSSSGPPLPPLMSDPETLEFIRGHHEDLCYSVTPLTPMKVRVKTDSMLEIFTKHSSRHNLDGEKPGVAYDYITVMDPWGVRWPAKLEVDEKESHTFIITCDWVRVARSDVLTPHTKMKISAGKESSELFVSFLPRKEKTIKKKKGKKEEDKEIPETSTGKGKGKLHF